MHSFYGTRLSENMAETPEGYLICYDVKIARIGTQDYLGSELGVDDDVVKVNRPAEEVFKPSTIASFEGKPFTNDHPYNLLDVNNTPIYEKGHVQNVRVSDDKTYLIADIMVKDSQTIQDIKNGKRELSAGYNCDCLQDKDGNWYQANIIGNHVALVDKGRAGEKVRINDAEFNEQDHPRGKDGKFTSGGGSAPKQEDLINDVEAFKKEYPIGTKFYEQYFGQIKEHSIKDIRFDKIDGVKIIDENGKEHFPFARDITLTKETSESNESSKKEQEEQKEDNHKRSLLEYDLKSMLKKISPNADYRYDPEDKTLEVRYLGEWEGDDGSGDYDWQTPTAETVKKVKEVQEQFKKRFGYNLSIESGEKNWMYFNIKDNKEKPMKDSKSSVLGKLLKAFAKDAEPEEMVEALEAVKGNDEEPDRLTKLETMVQDLCARMDAYDEATKQEAPELTALDEVEKELEDEEPEKKEEELEDEDLNNDPKLIEAQEEKAQNDEDTTEEIKKEVADAKKVIAKIADKELRLAVADSLASIIRGKIKYSDNYKKLMDASNKKPDVKDSKVIDYKAVFKKIKEDKFRK